jgi:transcriptional regulator with XRE-family HTH domain
MKDPEFGKRLKFLRDKAGLTQSEAAKKLGIGYSALQNHESGRWPNRPNQEKYIDFYQCDRNWFLTGKGDPFPGEAGGPEPEPDYNIHEEREIKTLGEALEAVTKLYASRDRHVIKSISASLDAFTAVIGKTKQSQEREKSLEEEASKLNHKLDVLLKMAIKIIKENRPPQGSAERRECIEDIKRFLINEGYPLPDFNDLN